VQLLSRSFEAQLSRLFQRTEGRGLGRNVAARMQDHSWPQRHVRLHVYENGKQRIPVVEHRDDELRAAPV
jgi:hypothetical protein